MRRTGRDWIARGARPADGGRPVPGGRSGASRLDPPARTGPTEPSARDVVDLGARSAAGLAALMAGAVPFLVLLALVEARWAPLHRLDTELVDRLNTAVATSEPAVHALRVLTDVGGTATATWVLTVAVACLLVRGRGRLATYLAVTGLGLAVLVPVTKALVGRARPDVALPVVELPGSASFPSGHATIATVTWGALLLVALPGARPSRRRVLVAVTVAVALVVGFTRVALGVHYLSDVVAGWALGVAWLAVVTGVFRRWLRGRGEAVHPVGTGVVTGPVADGHEPALPRGARGPLGPLAGWAVVLVVVTAAGVAFGAVGPDGVLHPGTAAAGGPAPGGDAQPGGPLGAAAALSRPWAVVMVTLAGCALGTASRRSWRPAVLVVAAVVGGALLAASARVTVPAVLAALGGEAAAPHPTGGLPSVPTAAATAGYGATILLAATALRGPRRWAVLGLGGLVVVAIAGARTVDPGQPVLGVVTGTLAGGLWLAVLHRTLLAGTTGTDGPSHPPGSAARGRDDHAAPGRTDRPDDRRERP